MKKLLFLSVFFFLPFFTHASPIVCATSSITGSPTQNAWEYSSTAGLIGMSFTVSSDCYPTGASLNIESAGTPASGARFAIYSDSSGSPGTLIEDGSVLSGVTGSFAYATSTFSGTTLLTSGTTYWLVAHWAASPLNMTDYYMIFEDGTSGSRVNRWNGSGYDALSYAKIFIAGDSSPYIPPVGSSAPFDEIFGSATSSASSTVSIVDNPVADLFDGFIIFFMSAFGIMWIFRRP